ncbi:hypothetical protein [Acidicapsa ligni]|uniref:hypothetical protein n=1 Tax=Acidicapsa ligni TaxID=542300 RepID=UPI0021DF7E13|nr:hypothetical protein [Acidicapsa ligni]
MPVNPHRWRLLALRMARHRGWYLAAACLAFLICVVFGIAYLVQAAPTLFTASATVRSLTFTVGNASDSAGIFNSDTSHIGLVLISPTTLTSDDGEKLNCVANTTFSAVKLLRMAMPQQLRIALEVENKGVLRYTLSPPAQIADPYLTIAIDAHSNLDGLACAPEQPKNRNGEWRIQATDPGSILEFAAHFAAPVQSVPTQAAPMIAGPDPELDIPLADASSLLLQGDIPSSSASPFRPRSTLQLIRSNRIIPLTDGFNLRDLRQASIKQLRFNPDTPSLNLDIAGAAKHIVIRMGEGQVEESESRFTSYRPHSFSTFITAAGTLLAGLGTIAAGYVAAHEFWRDNKRKKKRKKVVKS